MSEICGLPALPRCLWRGSTLAVWLDDTLARCSRLFRLCCGEISDFAAHSRSSRPPKPAFMKDGDWQVCIRCLRASASKSCSMTALQGRHLRVVGQC